MKKIALMFALLTVCMAVGAAEELSLEKFLATKTCKGCDLSNADLSDADLSKASLSLATLSNATLSNADLSKADLSNAKLEGAKFCKTITPWGKDNSGCWLNDEKHGSTEAEMDELTRRAGIANIGEVKWDKNDYPLLRG